MNELEKIRLHAAAMLGRLVDAAAQDGREETMIKHSTPVIDALAAHAIAALVHDPELHRLRQQLFADFLTNQLPNPNPPAEPSVDGWPGT